jgi:CubicO group peptidase (beta-lactamase class C family)
MNYFLRSITLPMILLLYQAGHSQSRTEFSDKVDAYVRPYVNTKNFSGTIMVAQHGKTLYLKAFGLADETSNIPNKADTKYHIASLSKSFTAAAILLLEERGLLHVSDPVARFILDFPNGNKITIHQLLTHTSGVPNINDMPEYDTVTRFPQTPASLVNIFKNKPRDFEPGAKYSYSNSNYNLLAYIIEKVSGQRYGDFIADNILGPLQMIHSGHDGEAKRIIENMASGYESDNNFGLEKASYLDWTAKTGNGSLYSTVEDLYKWDRALKEGKILAKSSTDKMFMVYAGHTGYGWFIDEHFHRKRIYFNGRSPGFSSYIGRYPADDVCIIVLGNNYIPLATQIGSDIAAILFSNKYEVPSIHNGKINPRLAQTLVGKYQFDTHFYRPNLLMNISDRNGQLFSDWGELIPEDSLGFIDRVYWQKVRFERDSTGRAKMIDYAGFKGVRMD